MKIAVISEYNLFTTVGGTEYYTDMLLKGLCTQGHELIFITKGMQPKQVENRQIQVAAESYSAFFLPSAGNSKAEVEQKVVSTSWKQMEPVLEQFQPDIIHVHTLTTFFNIRHFELCTQKFRNIFFTSHIPGHFCPKGDLIQNNDHPCNGKIAAKCSLCLFSKGIKTGIANLLFGYRQKVLNRLQKLNKLNVKVICTSRWQKEQMILNGYNQTAIHIIRQALITANYKKAKARLSGGKFCIGYLGRLSPEKGSAMLLKLIKLLKKESGFCFLLGIPENSNPDNMAELKQIMQESPAEIQVLGTIHAGNKQEFFEQIDCLLIPSYCIETGPIVLLEAAFYDKQVIAPDIGGPLEFAEEFPELVTSYSWNDVVSAITMIRKIRGRKFINSTDFESLFSAKEELFISDHLALYKRALAL